MLLTEELHISGISRRLGIAVPVVARHVKILEDSGLVERRVIGRTHLLKAKTDGVYEVLDETATTSSIELEKGSTILDALREVAAVGVKKVGDREYVVSIDGEDGYYLYEVDGRLLDTPMGEYILERASEVKLKKLLPVTKRIIRIKVTEKDGKRVEVDED
jgi:DNA-binding transcriptional ArsR family regulator